MIIAYRYMNIIKQRALSLIEGSIGKTGTVLAIRAWEPATFYEIDVHFPDVDMSDWEKVQSMKIKVGARSYRAYTPSGWDSKLRTCTLYVDALHEGEGSRWVRSLTVGESITNVGVGNTVHRGLPGKLVILGDISSIGHYLALQQLVGDRQLVGAISFLEESHMVHFFNNFKWDVQPVKQLDEGGFESLLAWALTQDLTDAEVYVVGHIPTCRALRKELKKRKDQPNSIRVQGFWS
jgi:NADPH-dependent ferric siderophore reductase